jgi:2-dehydropantoate 2-reductase
MTLRIAVIGIGAIGGWVAARFALAGHQVCAIARGATLAALSHGLSLTQSGETHVVFIEAFENAASLGPQDIVIVAVKAHALGAIASSVAKLCDADTIVVPLVNGVPWWFFLGENSAKPGLSLDSVDPGGAIAATIPLANVVGSVVHASCESVAPAQIVHRSGSGIILGEIGGENTGRLAKLVATFEKAGFAATASERIRHDVWYKLWGNMTMNPLSALTGAACNRILDDPGLMAFVLRTMAEASEIGSQIGCPIAESGRDRVAVTRKLGALRTSMLQDAEAGRTLEIDALLAAPREIAARIGIPTPNIDALLGMIRIFAEQHGLNCGNDATPQ